MNAMYCFTFIFIHASIAVLAIDAYHHHSHHDEREDGCKDNPWWNCNIAQNFAKCDSAIMKANCPITCDACSNCADMMGEKQCSKKTHSNYFCKSKYAYWCRKSCNKCDHEEGVAVDGGWSDWSDWDKCSASCGGGSTKRTRTCTNPEPQNGGKNCEGDDVESDVCGTGECELCQDNPFAKCEAAEGSCEDESVKRNCPVTCGACDYCVDMIGEYACKRAMGKNNFCDTTMAYKCRKSCEKCDASGNEEKISVDGGWTEWSDWDDCSKSCGNGETKRLRSCTNPEPENGGKDCEGEYIEYDVCATNPCPIDGGWGKWLTWSECSKTCDSGEVSRSRECDNPAPQHGGEDCDGEDLETVPCFLRPCDD